MADQRDEEVALAHVPGEEPATTDSRDVTANGSMKAENFNLDQWITGLSPVRRAVTIYGRADLRAEIDILSDRVRNAIEGTTAWQALVSQLAEARKTYENSALDVVVRALDADEAGRLFKAIEDAEGQEVRAARELEFTAAHIVAPSDLTLESLKAIRQVLPREVDRITVAATLADQASLAGVTAQFRQ